MRPFPFFCTVLLAYSVSVSAKQLSIDTSVKQFVSPLYLVVRGPGLAAQGTGQVLWNGFSICPTDVSPMGAVIECVSPSSSIVDFYINNQFAARDTVQPFILYGGIPAGQVSISCYSNFWYTTVTGTFACAGSAPPGLPASQSPIPAPSSSSIPPPTVTPSTSSIPSASSSTAPSSPPSAPPLPSTSSSSAPSSAPSTSPLPSVSSSAEPSSSPSTSVIPSVSSSAAPSYEPSTSPAPSSSSSSPPSNTPSSSPAPSSEPASSGRNEYRVTFSKIDDDYPLHVFEAGGTVLGSGSDKYLTVFGGFQGFPDITNAVYQRKFGTASAPWIKLANLPWPYATHMAQLNDAEGNLVCFAGGFMGAYPGSSGTRAFCFWRNENEYFDLPDLPGPRAGGGLVLVKDNGRHTLVYAGGTDRDDDFDHTDYGTTWTLNLFRNGAEWERAADMPDPRNHMAGISVCGRHFFVGGQYKTDERNGNRATVSEYLPESRSWSTSPPAELPVPLGHITASVMPYKCGMLVVGGMKNGVNMSDAVYYWDPNTDTWDQIGSYPHDVATPVCGIVGEEIMCATGGEWSDNRDVYFGKIDTRVTAFR